MQYSDSTTQNGELLRLVIPFLAKHRLPANPVAYTVSYEYLARSNKAVSKAIETRLDEGQEITNDFMHSLFEKYISPRDELHLRQVSDEIRRVIDHLAASTASTNCEATRFGQSLSQFSDTLGRTHTESALENIVKNLFSDTRTMQAAMFTMQAQLDEDKNEINVLRNQLQQIRQESLSDPLTGLTNR
ncbi:MAG: hypothetical protein L0Y43_08670, partial [Methylococcaceae bacterium]|nr:hypothetical protein [Methylococcaceae bacterium]